VQGTILSTELKYDADEGKVLLSLTSILSPGERRTRPPFPGYVAAGFCRPIHGTLH